MKQSAFESGLLFTQAHAAVRERIYIILSQYELTPSYWSILVAADAAEEGIRLSKVAKQMNVKAPLVTMLTNELIKMDLIKRLPHHSDGRAKLLVLTPHGKKLTAKLSDELNAEISLLMRGVSAGEAEAFQKTLQIILDNTETTQNF